jgi:hypothetical protein
MPIPDLLGILAGGSVTGMERPPRCRAMDSWVTG